MSVRGELKLTADAYVLKANAAEAAEQEVKVEPSVPTVRVAPCRHGLMCYFPHDFYLGGALDRYGEYAEEESAFLLSLIHPGDIVVEVGANIGCHTVALARHVTNTGRVLAFEPQRLIYQMLCGNLAMNGIWNVIAERCALGEKEGLIYVPLLDYTAPGNFGACELSREPGGEPTSMLLLDQYGVPRCDLIKIDVEGMELDVLQGAAKTIAKFRPILYVENDRKEKAQELIGYLDEMGYEMHWHLPKLYSQNNFRGNQENAYGDVVSINMLCLPREKERRSDLPLVLQRNGGGVLQ